MQPSPLSVLVTGAAGFIGFHLSKRLLAAGHTVIGVDIVNDYYSVQLKLDRLAELARHPQASAFHFEKADIADAVALNAIFERYQPSHVVNLAAQAGVRYSLINPHSYIQSNLVGFANILECCRHHHIAHLLFASSSSVYGLNRMSAEKAYCVEDNVDHPVSLYAATKKSNELMAHSYSHLYDLPCTGLRFFTVYGPWGRPDMALHLFTQAILAGKPIDVFNNGHMRRDFTYIDDIVEGVFRLLSQPASPNPLWNPEQPSPATSSAPWSIYNIGNNQAVELMDFIQLLEKALGRTAIKNFLPMQAGDVQATYANIDALSELVGFAPHVSLAEGLGHFVQWHLGYY